MKKILKKSLTVSLVLVFLLGAAFIYSSPAEASYEGRYVGYSWAGEANGVAREDASRYIKTVLELDKDGIITDANMWFFVQNDGYWTTRQSGNAYIDVDFDVNPTMAVPGENYEAGDSMFTIYTTDMMAFYATAVNNDGVIAAVMVDPITRYQFEMKFDADFDFSRPVGDLTIGSDYVTPTIRTSGSGLLKPDTWDDLENSTIFDVHGWSHVVNMTGELEGIDTDSTIEEKLTALGVEFADGQPQPKEVEYGYFGTGGWEGNFEAIEEYLIGRDATEHTSLIDWSIDRYAGGVNEDNIFGVDVESGATRTAQNSIDTLSGATVRVSRESTSYQRALVAAGILEESDVVIGRF